MQGGILVPLGPFLVPFPLTYGDERDIFGIGTLCSLRICKKIGKNAHLKIHGTARWKKPHARPGYMKQRTPLQKNGGHILERPNGTVERWGTMGQGASYSRWNLGQEHVPYTAHWKIFYFHEIIKNYDDPQAIRSSWVWDIRNPRENLACIMGHTCPFGIFTFYGSIAAGCRLKMAL